MPAEQPRETRRVARQPMTRGGDPGGVAISLARDGERRAGDWPGTDRSGKPRGERRLARRESDTQAGEAEEFSEGTQHDEAGCVGRADEIGRASCRERVESWGAGSAGEMR